MIDLLEGPGKMRWAVEPTSIGDSFDRIGRRKQQILGLAQTIKQQVLVRCAIQVFFEASDEVRSTDAAESG